MTPRNLDNPKLAPSSPRNSPSRWLMGACLAVALLATGVVQAFPPDQSMTYYFYTWQASALDPGDRIRIAGTTVSTCDDYSRGSVCAEFRSYMNGSVAGTCCVDPSALGLNDPGLCLVGATIQRDQAPEE